MYSLNKEDIDKYKNIAKNIRKEVLEIIYDTNSPHIGCCFSMADILVALYFKILSVDSKRPDDPNRDRLILSKGHAAPVLYAVLKEKGFIDENTFNGIAQSPGTLEVHPTRDITRGIEITSGSLGHGLSVAAGMALAGKYDDTKYRIFTLLGDGELNEGSNWEAIMFASHHKLDNMVAIIDCNGLQVFGKNSKIMNIEPLVEKWKSFGWSVKKINGHNFEEIINSLSDIPFEKDKPSCIVAETIHGKGVSFMEDNHVWHDKYPNEEEYKSALKELEQ